MEKFINQLCHETFGEFRDAMWGEALDGDLIKKAREAETETFKKHGVFEKVPLEEHWRVIGKAPVGVSGSTRTWAIRRSWSAGADWWRRRLR